MAAAETPLKLAIRFGSAVILVLCVMLQAAAVAAEHYSALGVGFDTSVALGKPTRIGLGAVLFPFPAAASLQDTTMSLILVSISQQQQQEMKAAGQDVMQYVRVTYLGLTEKPKDTIQLVVAARKVSAERFIRSIPKPGETIVCPLLLRDKSLLVLAEEYGQTTNATAKQLLDDVGRSFQEESSSQP